VARWPGGPETAGAVGIVGIEYQRTRVDGHQTKNRLEVAIVVPLRKFYTVYDDIRRVRFGCQAGTGD